MSGFILPFEADRRQQIDDLTAKAAQHLREAKAPELQAHHKVQRKILANNIFVQISAKYPHIRRSERKAMADRIARARVKEFLEARKPEKQELNTLREQDYQELPGKDQKEIRRNG